MDSYLNQILSTDERRVQQVSLKRKTAYVPPWETTEPLAGPGFGKLAGKVGREEGRSHFLRSTVSVFLQANCISEGVCSLGTSDVPERRCKLGPHCRGACKELITWGGLKQPGRKDSLVRGRLVFVSKRKLLSLGSSVVTLLYYPWVSEPWAQMREG